MSTLGKIARGLASGYGNYLGQQAQLSLQDRMEQLKTDRAMALAKYQGEVSRENMTHQGSINAGLDTVKTDNEIRQTNETLGPKTAAQIKVNTAQETAEQANKVALANLGHTLKLSEQEHESGLQLANEAAKLGMTVDRYEFTANGRMVALSKDGKVISQTRKPGEFNPTRAPRENDDPFSLDEAAPPRAPQRGAAPAKPAAAAAPQGKIYGEDDILETMRSNKLTRAEAVKRIEALGYTRQ